MGDWSTVEWKQCKAMVLYLFSWQAEWVVSSPSACWIHQWTQSGYWGRHDGASSSLVERSRVQPSPIQPCGEGKWHGPHRRKGMWPPQPQRGKGTWPSPKPATWWEGDMAWTTAYQGGRRGMAQTVAGVGEGGGLSQTSFTGGGDMALAQPSCIALPLPSVPTLGVPHRLGSKALQAAFGWGRGGDRGWAPLT